VESGSEKSPVSFQHDTQPNGSYSILVDITDTLLSRWSNLTTTLPTSSQELAAYFNKPLEEDDKVPLSHLSMSTLVSRGGPKIKCSERDLQRIFRSSEDEESDYIWTTLKATINAGAPDSDGTEASFHSFWDDNIRKIITLIDTPNKIIRNSNRGTSARSQTLASCFKVSAPSGGKRSRAVTQGGILKTSYLIN
jgi:hypothetical protein